MGAERWLLFKSRKEALKARQYLGAHADGMEVSPSSIDGLDRKTDCWFEWPSAKKLSIGYSFGGLNGEMAPLIMRELCKRFTVHRIGADSVGWYPDSDWLDKSPYSSGSQYPGYAAWTVWANDYKVEWSDYGKILPGEMHWLHQLDKAVTAVFTALDKQCSTN